MFGEGYEEDKKASEAAKQQQAEQNARAREATNPNRQDNESDTATRTTLSSSNGLGERPQEEIDEINETLKEYEVDALLHDEPPFTEEEKVRLINEIAAEIDARKAAAKLPTASAATVTHLAASAPARVAEPTQQPSVKAAAVSLPAPVKATSVLPPQPPQESLFERQKKVQLQNLRDKIEAAKLELAKQEATRNTLQQELEQHLQRQPKEKAQILARLQKPIDDFKATNFFSSRITGTDEHYQLQGLRAKRDAATLAETPSVVTTRAALETAKNSIETLNSSIKSLNQKHATVLRELEVSKRDRLTREVAEAAAAARAEALAWEKIGSTAIVKRSSLGSTSSEGNDSQPSTPAGKQRSSSEGSSSGNESNQSTPEKQPLLTATFTTATMAEVEHLQSKIARAHEFISKARELLKEEKKYLFLPKLMEVWSQYFDLAEQRSRLKQNLATLMGHIPEPVFRRPENVAELVLQYRNAFELIKRIKSPYLNDWNWTGAFKSLYKEHGVYDMKQHSQHPTIRELEQPLIESFQRCYQQAVEKFLKINLALVAPEEQPPILQKLENCIWQNMPEFSNGQRDSAMTKAFLEARSSGYYSTSSNASDWWKREGQQQSIQRSYNFSQQQLTANWNAQQTSMMQSSMVNGGYYQPNYRTW